MSKYIMKYIYDVKGKIVGAVDIDPKNRKRYWLYHRKRFLSYYN